MFLKKKGNDVQKPLQWINNRKKPLLKLQTNITLKPIAHPISYQSKVMLLGSCFATHLGEQLAYYKFQNLQNPFGILFHPHAISTFLWRVLHQEYYVVDELLFHNEQWHCFDAHSACSGTDSDEVLHGLNSALTSTLGFLQQATHVVMTLGTAWGYRLKALEEVVANCHKVPQSEFDKVLLTVADVQESLENCISYIRAINPSATLVFTVSPVRHLKDGFVENTRSKAHLIAGVHQLLPTSKNTTYFPSYELMMDELRDYRFYAQDMIHPSPLAIAYIWERFCETYVDPATSETMEQVDSLQKKMKHRPFYPESKAHQQFLQQLEAQKQALRTAHPFFQF